jgi:thioredoxin 1
MTKTTRILIVFAVVAAAALAFVARERRSASPSGATGPAAVSKTAPATAKLPRLVDLGASACVPCKMMKPILDDLMANYADQFTTEFIDVWKDREAGHAHGVEMIPTQIFYDAEGKELFRHVGFFSKEDILAKWRELGVTTADADANKNKTTP